MQVYRFILGGILFLLTLLVYWRCQTQGKGLQALSNASFFQEIDNQGTKPLTNAYSSAPETAEMDTMIVRFLHQWEMTGASLAIVKEGKLVYAQGFGYADKERKVKMQPYHRLRIASVSKLLTAVGIMRLVEQGKLRLNDKVFGKNGILNDRPAYQKIADTLAYKIEIEHLLTHTAGWRNIFRTDPMFVPVLVAQAMKADSPPPLDVTIEFMLSQRGMFEPGTLYDYSNFGYCLLGRIIEKVSRMSYEKYMQEQILRPAAITQMRIGKNRYKERFPHEAKYYSHRKATQNYNIYNPKDSADRAYEGTNTELLSSAGGWIASATDIAKFVTTTDGFQTVPDILKKETITRMTTPVAKDSTQQRLIGWKQVDEEKWWRTGSLESTSISVTRRHDGFTWVFITNTGSWRGPFFVYEIEGLMRRALKTVPPFPAWDLFTLTASK